MAVIELMEKTVFIISQLNKFQAGCVPRQSSAMQWTENKETSLKGDREKVHP
jgi:hypothetical protein